MTAAPQPDGSWGPADDRDVDRPSHYPTDETKDKPDDGAAEQELEKRSQLRDRVENPAYFVADPADFPAAFDESERPIFPLSGNIFLAVRRDWAEEPLRDPEARIGVCDVHPLPTTVPAEDNPCAYQSVSYVVASSPSELRQALWSEALIGSTDLPPQALWKSIDKHWCIVEVEVEAVRCALLFDDPALPGGEPQLRHDGQRLTSDDAGSWRRVRNMLDQDAAMVILGGDPEGIAQRIVIFTLPGTALTKVKALKWGEPIAFGEFDSWHGLGRGAWLRASQLPNRQSFIRRGRSELKFQYRMWRANCRAARDERRERRDLRRQASATRWQVRRVIFEGLRELIAVVREAAEALIVVAKAILFVIVVIGAPPTLVIGAVKLIMHLS